MTDKIPPKKQRKLVNWEPSKPGRRALRVIREITGNNQKTAIEKALINEASRLQKGVVL